MTGQTHKPNPLLDALNAKVEALATRLIDEALAEQGPELKLRVGAVVDAVLKQRCDELTTLAHEVHKTRTNPVFADWFRDKVAGDRVADFIRESQGRANPPKIPDSCERCGYPGEMLDVGICTECGTGSYAHTDACPVGQAIDRAEKQLFDEATEGDDLCGECGVVDYDHKQSCPSYVPDEETLEEMGAPAEEPDELLSIAAVERDLKAGKHSGHDNRRTVAFTRDDAEAPPVPHIGRPLMREADGDVDRRYKAGLMRADPTADAALGAPPTPTAADEAPHDDGLPDAVGYGTFVALGEDRADELARAVVIVTSASEPMTTSQLRDELDISEADWVAIRPHLARRVKVDTAYNYKGRRGKHTLWSARDGGAE